MKTGIRVISITSGKHKRRNQFSPDDPGEIPVFSASEVARSLRMGLDRLIGWTKPRAGLGRLHENFDALIVPAGDGDSPLSFYNALEAHMLLGARRHHNVSMIHVRRALHWTKQQLPSRHPLIDYKFQTNGKHLFVSKLVESRVSEMREAGLGEEELVNASLLGQREMTEIVELFLNRIIREDSGLARRLFPVMPQTNGESRPVMMDMNLSSGRLVIENSGISAVTVYGRYKFGHSVDKLARDYRISSERIKGAIDYLESAA